MSYSTPEGRVVRKILDYLNSLPRTTAHKMHGSKFNVGEPDIDCVSHGRAVKLEVKVPGTEHAIRAHVTPLQRAGLLKYARAGAIVGVVVSVAEVEALLWGIAPITYDADYEGIVARVNARLDADVTAS